MDASLTEMNENFYKKLETLFVVHPPSEGFKRIFTPNMFLKPNQEAFLQVMNYLFNLFDPAEYKKRFSWPTCDKHSETVYRSSTVDYLNYLNEKYNLNWKHLIRYLVVMPGGIKFISFLNDFIDFISGELINRLEKALFGNSRKVRHCTKQIIGKLSQQNEKLTSQSSRYAEELDKATAVIHEKRNLLKSKLHEIATSQSLTVDYIIDTNFLKKWNTYNIQHFKQIESLTENKRNDINVLFQSLIEFKNKTEIAISKRKDVSYDIDELKESYTFIQSQHPELQGKSLFIGCELNIVTIIEALTLITPKIDKIICEKLQESARINWESKCKDMDNLKVELNNIKLNAIKFSETLKNYSSPVASTSNNVGGGNLVYATPNAAKLTLNPNFLAKYIETPPIRFNINRKNLVFERPPHLPFLDDYRAQQQQQQQGQQPEENFSNVSFNQTIFTQNKSGKKGTIHQSAGKDKSKDALTVLRTIRKMSHYSNNNDGLSKLASKWKENELNFDFDEGKETVKNSSERETGPKPSTSTSLTSQNKQKSSIKTIDEYLNSIHQKKKTHLDNMIKNSAIILSPDQQRNLNNPCASNNKFDIVKLTTSPSGRLESLVKIDISRIVISDADAENFIEKEQVVAIDNKENVHQQFNSNINIEDKGFLVKENLKDEQLSESNNILKANNSMDDFNFKTPTSFKELNQSIKLDISEFISNVSDTVLEDITM